MAIQAEGDNVEKRAKPELLKDGLTYTGDKGPTFGARHVQVCVMAIGFGLAFSYRPMFSVVIVAMTDKNSSQNADVPTYDWDNKNVVISSVFWGAVCLQLISGYLGKQYGPKWFVLVASVIDSLGYMLIPFAAKYSGSTGVITCRVIQGLTQGMILPMNTCVMGRWVPTEERSRMGFIGTGAITILVVITSVATGYIADSSLGWPWVFYTFGGVNLVWCVVFGIVAKQSPDDHPRITPEEKNYIQISLSQKTNQNVPTPWKKIFTSIYFWAILIGQIGAGWIIILVSSEMSIFMAKVMKYGVKSNGIITALPPLFGTISGIGISFLSDYIPRKNILTLLNSRRTFHTIGMAGVSTCLLAMTFVPVKQSTWAVVILCLGNAFLICSVVGGSSVNALDISPMFAGIMFGCYNTFSNSIAILAPLLIQWVVHDESDATQWRHIFIVTAVIAVGTAIFFDIFATATRQNWDAEDEKDAQITRARRKSSIVSNSGIIVP